MPSSSSLSPDERDGLLRRFLVASRRGEIVALINAARLEEDLGAVVATELCEAYDAEIGFVLVARAGSATAELIGGVGLLGADPASIFAQPVCSEALSGAVTVTEHGTDLLGLGIRDLAQTPQTAGGARLLVGVGRLYEQHFDALELALLEGVTKSAAQALERLGLEHRLQRAHEMEAVGLSGDITREFYGALATIIGHCDVGTDSVSGGASEAATVLRQIRADAEAAAELLQQVAVSRQQAPPPVALDVTAIESQPPEEIPLPSDLGSLADLFRLLAHPVRLQILLALGSETLSPSELQQRLGVGLGLLSYHVGALRSGGLLTLVDTRPSRGALESFYRLTDRGELARTVLRATWREIDDRASRSQ